MVNAGRDMILSIPISLGNPVNDPNGIFKRIGAPQLPHLDSLMHWLQYKTPATPFGWLGIATPAWVQLIRKASHTDPALLSLTAIGALQVLNASTKTHSVKYMQRAILSTIEELKKYRTVSSLLLVIITTLTLDAARTRDTVSFEAHSMALKNLYREDIKIDPLEWGFVWGMDDLIATMLKRIPLLPNYTPQELKDSMRVSADEISRIHRLAAKNTLELRSLLEFDYLLVSSLIQELHQLRSLDLSRLFAEQFSSVSAFTISLSRRLHRFARQCESEYQISKDSLALCKYLLALSLLACAWHQILVVMYMHEYDPNARESQAPGILKTLLDSSTTILVKAGSSRRMVDKWTENSSSKTLIVVSCMMALLERDRSHQNLDPEVSWIHVLGLAVSDAGISSAKELQDLLSEWPCDDRQIAFAIKECGLTDFQ